MIKEKQPVMVNNRKAIINPVTIKLNNEESKLVHNAVDSLIDLSTLINSNASNIAITLEKLPNWNKMNESHATMLKVSMRQARLIHNTMYGIYHMSNNDLFNQHISNVAQSIMDEKDPY